MIRLKICVGETTLDYLSGFNVITRVIRRRCDVRVRDAEKDKETDFSLQSPQRMQSSDTSILGIVTTNTLR